MSIRKGYFENNIAQKGNMRRYQLSNFHWSTPLTFQFVLLVAQNVVQGIFCRFKELNSMSWAYAKDAKTNNLNIFIVNKCRW